MKILPGYTVPPMRVDLKAIVEHQFNIVNDLGFVHSKTRGHDYHLNAKLNLNEFYSLIITHVRRKTLSIARLAGIRHLRRPKRTGNKFRLHSSIKGRGWKKSWNGL